METETENLTVAADFFIKELPKCNLCYYTKMELVKFRKDKGKAFDPKQFTNIKLANLLDFEIKVKRFIGDTFAKDNIAAMEYLAKFIEFYPDYKGWLVTWVPGSGREDDNKSCDYHFNLPVKSKKKNINAITARMLDLLAKKANRLLKDFNSYPTKAREIFLNDLINVLNEHLLMIYQCMLYHRPDIYTDIFKELKLDPFNIKLEKI